MPESHDTAAAEELRADELEDAVVVEDDTVEEVADAELVVASVRPLSRERIAGLPVPAVQAAAVAATGFVAGAATVAVMRAMSARRAAARTSPSRVKRVAEGLPIAGSRQFLVDVHLIGQQQPAE